MQNEKLWNAIQAHPFSDAFVDALMAEQKWTRPFALAAIEEYRRFLFLTQVSDSPATPSKLIDKVWHLHMTHTRDYWDEFCTKVLGKPLHHEPGTGATDASRFEEQFKKTKALYRVCFEEDPQPEFWGNPPKRRRPSAKQIVVLVFAALLVYFGVTQDQLYVTFLFVMCAFLLIVEVFGLQPLRGGRSRRSRSKSSPWGHCSAGCGSSCAADCGGGD